MLSTIETKKNQHKCNMKVIMKLTRKVSIVSGVGSQVRVSLRDNGGEKEETSIEVESPILKAFQRVWFYVH